jgi:hypothetical protein
MIVIRKETQSVLVVKVHINLEFCGLLCGLNWENSRVKRRFMEKLGMELICLRTFVWFELGEFTSKKITSTHMHESKTWQCYYWFSYLILSSMMNVSHQLSVQFFYLFYIKVTDQFTHTPLFIKFLFLFFNIYKKSMMNEFFFFFLYGKVFELSTGMMMSYIL